MKSPFRFALALLALAAIAPVHAQVMPDPLGQVVNVQGQVLATPPGSTSFTPVVPGQSLFMGQTLTVGPNSSLVAQYVSGQQYRIFTPYTGPAQGLFLPQYVCPAAVCAPIGVNPPFFGGTLGSIGGIVGGAIATGLATGTIETSNSSKPPIQPVSP